MISPTMAKDPQLLLQSNKKQLLEGAPAISSNVKAEIQIQAQLKVQNDLSGRSGLVRKGTGNYNTRQLKGMRNRNPYFQMQMVGRTKSNNLGHPLNNKREADQTQKNKLLLQNLEINQQRSKQDLDQNPNLAILKNNFSGFDKNAKNQQENKYAPLDEKTPYNKSTKNMYVFSGQKHASVTNVERGRRMDKSFSPGFKNYQKVGKHGIANANQNIHKSNFQD